MKTKNILKYWKIIILVLVVIIGTIFFANRVTSSPASADEIIVSPDSDSLRNSQPESFITDEENTVDPVVVPKSKPSTKSTTDSSANKTTTPTTSSTPNSITPTPTDTTPVITDQVDELPPAPPTD